MREIQAWLSYMATILLTTMLTCYVSADENYCYAETDNAFIFLGAKSSYELIRQNKTYQKVSPKCTPIKLWMIHRHGTRYIDISKIHMFQTAAEIRDKIVRHYEENDDSGRICWKDIDNFKKWTHNLTADLSNQLTSQGREELRLHAARLKESFPALFDAPYTEKQFEFQSTSEERAVDSAMVFAEAMFGPKSIDILNPIQNDLLLHGEKYCHKWRNFGKSPEKLKEYILFKDSVYVKNVVKRVNYRLGLKENLTVGEVIVMYEICRYETAWNIHSRSPFCAPFTHNDIKVIEYLEDIRYYYINGYGSEMSSQLGCALLTDLMQKFSKISSTKNEADSNPPVTLYFTHMGPILQFISALGIRKDEQDLRHDNFESMSNRQWRMSKMIPFGCNFVAVFYICEDTVEDNIVFYLNEDIVYFPGCRDGLCSWDYIFNKFKSFLDPETCNLNQHCT